MPLRLWSLRREEAETLPSSCDEPTLMLVWGSSSTADDRSSTGGVRCASGNDEGPVRFIGTESVLCLNVSSGCRRCPSGSADASGSCCRLLCTGFAGLDRACGHKQPARWCPDWRSLLPRDVLRCLDLGHVPRAPANPAGGPEPCGESDRQDSQRCPSPMRLLGHHVLAVIESLVLSCLAWLLGVGTCGESVLLAAFFSGSPSGRYSMPGTFGVGKTAAVLCCSCGPVRTG